MFSLLGTHFEKDENCGSSPQHPTGFGVHLSIPCSPLFWGWDPTDSGLRPPTHWGPMTREAAPVPPRSLDLRTRHWGCRSFLLLPGGDARRGAWAGAGGGFVGEAGSSFIPGWPELKAASGRRRPLPTPRAPVPSREKAAVLTRAAHSCSFTPYAQGWRERICFQPMPFWGVCCLFYDPQ